MSRGRFAGLIIGFALCAIAPAAAQAACGSPVQSGSTVTVTCTPGIGTINVPEHSGDVGVLGVGGAGGTSPLQSHSGAPGSELGTLSEAGPFVLDVDVGAAGGNATATSAGTGGAPGGGNGSVGPSESGGGGGGYTAVADATTSTFLMFVGGGGGAGGSNTSVTGARGTTQFFGAGGAGAGDSSFYPSGQPGGGCPTPPESSCDPVDGGGATVSSPGTGDSSDPGGIPGNPGVGSAGGAGGTGSGGGGGGGGCFGGGGGGSDELGPGDDGGGGGGGSSCFDLSLTNVSQPAEAGPNGEVVVAWTAAQSVAPTITSTGPATFNVGSNGSYQITATGSPTPTVTLDDPGDLPPGLTFNYTDGSGTATISGTPTCSANNTLTIRASNGVSPDATQSLQVQVGGGSPCYGGVVGTSPSGSKSSGGGTVDAGNGAKRPPVSTTSSGVHVKLTCSGSSGTSCEGQVTLTTGVKHHKKPVVVGRATYKLAAGQAKIVKVSLNSTGRRLLRAEHRLKVKVRIYVRAPRGLRQVVTESVTLKQKK